MSGQFCQNWNFPITIKNLRVKVKLATIERRAMDD